MKSNIFMKITCFILVLFVIGSFALPASAAYLCTPDKLVPVYDADENTLSISGTYSGIIQPTRVYMISLADAKGRMISTKNPTGSELDKGNGAFEYSVYIDADALASYTMPMKLTLSCTTANGIAPISAEVLEAITLSFVSDGNGTLSGNTAIKVPAGFATADLDTLALPEISPNEGFFFDSWSYNATDSFTEDTVITAVFVKKALGDVNGDGNVDNLDATLILQYDAGITQNDIPLSVGDTNYDNIVDNLDAAKILKYDAGLIDEL